MWRCLTVVVSVERGGEELLNTVQGVHARGCLVITDDQIRISHIMQMGKGAQQGTSQLDKWLKKYFHSALFKLWAMLKFDSCKNTTKFNGYTSNSIFSVDSWMEINTQSPEICSHFSSSQGLNKIFHILLSLWFKLWALQILEMFREPLNN